MSTTSRPRASSTDGDRLRHVVNHAAHLLPVQGPIGVFIHHNTLHAFEHLRFEQAVVEASRLFGTEPYMRSEQYLEQFRKGRILVEDLETVLASECDAPAFANVSRRMLRRLMLVPGVRTLHAATVVWELEDGGLIRGRAERELFAVCLEHTEPAAAPSPSRRRFALRTALLEATGDDLHEIVHPMLIRLCGGYLDQGLAYWPMPGREAGFYEVVRGLWMQPGSVLPAHLRGIVQAFRAQAEAGVTPVDAILTALAELEIPPHDWEPFIVDELLALPGWAGLMRRLEEDPSLAPHEQLPCSLLDFLAVRLTLTSVAARSIAGTQDVLRSIRLLEPPVPVESDRLVRAARLFQVARLLEMQPETIALASRDELLQLQREVDAFDDLEARRIWHLAYERRHERLILGPLAAHRQSSEPHEFTGRPTAQVFFCIDEREESIRRHLEEIAPDYETLSAAGFFGIAVDYAGIDDAHGVALCPVVLKPQHAVREQPVAEHSRLHARRQALRAIWAHGVHHASIASRTLFRGAVSTSILGTLSLFPLIARVLSPRRYSQLMLHLNAWILPEPRTELTLMRTDKQGLDVAEDLLVGFDLEEKADRVASVLGPAGLTRRFARIVVILGHGSTSLNNPHESAHDCGACGGRRGGPNARLFAAMANRPEVRELLKSRGIHIPGDTWFVGGYHDTCSDQIDYYDTDLLPPDHQEEFRAIVATLHRARALDAHERSRRFEAAPSNPSPGAALWHVQERSEHLAQPRPEYGHCTNAACIVGRRGITRGLFFDRRAFLVSYDPIQDNKGQDNEGANLARLLGAAIPVCAGISLEYYFSFVDNEGYGCGTKLPHNITGLVGIMNGNASDLRTGLPWQMVEIHEPVRILFVIETTPAILMKVVRANPVLTQLVEKRWVRLSTIDPETGAVHVYRDGAFIESPPASEPIPEAAGSREWYRGTREHLPVARIRSAHPAPVAAGQ